MSSMQSLCLTLALTASVTSANVAQLLNLQQQVVNEMDYEHGEPEVDTPIWNRKHYEHATHYP